MVSFSEVSGEMKKCVNSLKSGPLLSASSLGAFVRGFRDASHGKRPCMLPEEGEGFHVTFVRTVPKKGASLFTWRYSP